MKQIITFLMLMLALTLAPMSAVADNHDTVVQDSNGYIPFGRYYWQVNGQPSGGYENHYYAPESEGGERNALTSWAVESGSPKELEAYLHMPAGNTSLTLDVTTSGSTTFQFIVKTATGTQLSSTTQTVNGTKSVSVMSNVNLPASAYYSIRIKVTSGHANISKITRWKITKTSSEQAYLPDYLSSPSVHTNEWKTTDATAPAGNSYDWAYEEVMVPASSDIVGTYCMSLGVFHGYMGIQVNGPNQHDIIFSMWDNGSTDKDPNLPDYLRSGSLDGNGGVSLSRFGGEGTGAKAFRSGNYWVPGKWVKFLCNARPELVTVETANGPITYTNTLVTAWYKTEGGADNETNAEEGEEQYDGWHYIATHRLSGGNTFMNGWYSFLENYNWPSGNMKRTAYYRNGALHALNSGKWSHRNYVSCSHTDGGDDAGKRNDYGTGIETVEDEPAFYMTTGGYNNDAFVETQTMTLKENFVPVTQETMDKLLGRVAQAIQHEQERKVTDELESTRETLSNTGITMVSQNSQQNDQPASNAFDGSESTAWHTKWNGNGTGNGSGQWPFEVVIQLPESLRSAEIEQIAFYTDRVENYRPKTVQIYYSDNNSKWTSAGSYSLENANRTRLTLKSILTGHQYVKISFTEGYGSFIYMNEINFRTAYSKSAINEQVQDILNKENRFDGYSTADLAALKTAYSSGNWTDENAVRTALLNLAANGTLLKYGTPTAKESLSSFKAYQLHNAFGLGDLIVKTTPAVAADNDVDVTDLNNNWQLLRSEKWNAYYLYNSGAQKYLAFNNGTATLTDKPTPVYVGTRSHKETVDDETVTVFDGFTFQFDPADANSFLTAPAASASVRGMNKVAPANTSAVTLGASNTDGAVWQLRDNYGVTPAAVNVNELLEEAEEEGAPEGFDGEGYTIRLNNTNLYLSTFEVDDKGKSTYSLSTYPEYFKVVSTGANTYTLQSATTKKYVGYTGAPTGWDVVNHADTWTIADIEGGVTTIIKSGNQGLGANSNEQAAGHGVFTNKTDTHQWIFTHYEGSSEEPEDEGVIKMSTGDTKYYYSIRNVNNPQNYAHYDGNNKNLALNSNKVPSAVFYFTEAQGAPTVDGAIAVNIHNLTSANLVMNDWTNWGSTPSMNWYISDATGTANVANDYNIRRSNSGNNYWNHQGVGVASWGAGTDPGSAWYIEAVPTTELTVAVHGLTGQGGVAYNGTTYTNGQKFTAFFENPTIEAASVDGYSATVTVYKGVANVDYTETDPFFSTSTTNAAYHKIAFNSNKNIVISTNTNTDGQYLTSTKSSSYASNWAFIGTIDNFVLYDGTHYVGMKNDFLAPVSDLADATTFKIINNGDGTYGIVRPSNAGQGFNSNTGVADGKKIGFYGVGDNGSKLVFYETDGTTLNNPTFPRSEYDIEGATSFTAPSKNTLWYTEAPGTNYNNWMEYSLPIGNGDFGGSVYGAVMNDKITVNEKSLWDGKSETNYSYAGYVKMGNVWVKNLSNAFENGVKNYVRYLDIDNAVAGVEFSDAQGTKYTRTYIASAPDNVMAVRYTATGTNKLNLQFTYEPGGQLTSSSVSGQKPTTEYAANGLVGTAKFNGKLPIVSYASQMTVKATDGTVTEDYKGITVSDATEVIVYLAGGTDFTAAHPATSFVDGTASQLPGIMASRINTASGKGWDNILSAHKSNFQSYMGRVAIDLKKNGASVSSNKNTKALVDFYNTSADNKNTADGIYLEQLYYNYGRYLLISSNRNTSVPNNLQGLWNDTDSGNAPWHSDIHTNINIQMNYWPAEPNNLSDLHKPFLDHIKMLADAPGPKNQAKTKGSNVGWVINTESNLFGGMSDFKSNYTIANAWYVTHLWQHYRYTLDTEFLKSAFPAMLGAAKYWSQRLVQGTDGSYECPSEWSPEQGPDENATAHSQQLVRELFDNTIEAANTINAVSLNLMTQADLNDLTNKRAGLDLGLRTEEYQHSFVGSDGKQKNWNTLIEDGTPILKEWKTSSYQVGENQHRHTSHLMALYPFSQLTQDVTADGTTYTAQQLFDAAKASLTQRSDNSTGWAMGWRVNLWARALDGNHARTLINNALKHARSYATDQSAGGIYYNLWDSHAPFQIDGNFGVCAGVSEMLLQSHTGVIQLLPALPDAWAEGSITGLKAVGNFTVNQEWAEGALTKATITSHKGQPLKVKSTTLDLATEAKITVNGTLVTPTVADGVYTIDCPEGGIVEIVSNDIPEEPAQTFVFKNKQKGTYAYYDASKKNNDDILVSLGSETDATKFQLDGNETNGYKIKYVDGETTHFVKYQNENDANYNVVFTDNEAEATSWKIVQTYVQDGKIYYNILVSDANTRGWNARGEDSKPSVGFWNKGTNMGGNDGSLWQVIANPGDAATVTYTYTLNGEMAKTETYNVTKGSFMPKYNLPYGITTTEAQPTGYVAGNISKTIACSYIENYPIIPAKSASSITNYYYLGQHSSTKASWHYTTEGSNNVVASGANVENDSNYLWAFVGNPFTGYQIVNKAAGTAMTLRSNSAPYVLETSPSKNTWMIANATEKGFFLSPAGGSGYINLQSGLLQNYGSADDGSTTVAEAYLAPGPEAVEIDHTISPAEGNVVSTDLTTIAIKFAEEYTEQGVGPYPAEEMSQPVVYPTLTRQGGTPITATAIEMNDDTGFWEFTFPQDSFAEGSWTLNIPQGTFYVMGEFNMETEDIELIPIKAITATYNVVSGEVVATLTINGEETNYYEGNDIVLNDSQTGLTKVVIPNDVDDVDVTYTRNFTSKNATAWQAWYVPFDYTLTSEDVNAFDFAFIWTLRVDVKTGKATNIIYEDLVAGDVLEANTPYLIKAKAATTEPYAFNATGLRATEENRIDCSTTGFRYDFVGNYESFVLGEYPYYALDNNGAFAYTSSTTYKLQPYRYYMYITDKETSEVLDPHNSSNVQKLTLIHRGENDEQTTSINTINKNKNRAITVDLTGRIVSDPRAGLFISNGKKYIVK